MARGSRQIRLGREVPRRIWLGARGVKRLQANARRGRSSESTGQPAYLHGLVRAYSLFVLDSTCMYGMVVGECCGISGAPVVTTNY